MWVSRLHLASFGIFRDFSLSGLTPGLNLLFGLNEAGKTSLMMFLRAMLFGFKTSSYDPLDLSEPGGNLTLMDDHHREWLIERTGRGRKAQVTVSGPQGVIKGEEGVRPLVHEITREVYENIFAFGLKELYDVETLNRREVQHLLYSASLGLGPLSLKAVEDDLAKQQLKDLFNPDKRASTPEINQILAELGKVRQAIRELERQPQEYQDLKEALSRGRERLGALTAAEQEADRECRWLDKLHRNRDLWEEWQLNQVALKELPALDNFPAEGLKRWEQTQADLSEVTHELDTWQRELAAAQAAATELAPDPRLLAAQALMESLWADRKLFESRREEYNRRGADLAAARPRLKDSLTVLGPEWNEARLKTAHFPLAWQAALKEWRRRLEETHQNRRQGQERVQNFEDPLREKLARWEQAQATGPFRGGSRSLLWGCAGVGLTLTLAAAGTYLLGRVQAAGMLAAAGVAAFLAALLNGLQLVAAHRRRLQELEDDYRTGAQTLAKLQASLEESQGDLDQAREAWQVWLKESSLSPAMSPETVADLLQEVDKARGHLDDLTEHLQGEKLLEEYLEEFTRRVADLLAQLDRPPVSREEVSATLIKLAQELTDARKAADAREKLEEKIATAQEGVAKWQSKSLLLEEALKRLLEAAGLPDEEAFRRQADLAQRRQEYEEQTGRLAAQLRAAAGGEEALEQLHADQSRTTREDLAQGLRRAQDRLRELKTELADTQEHQGQVKDRLANLERADDLSRELLQEQELAARLQDAARKWTVLTLCRHYLEEGRRRFEAEYQPQVLRRASGYFELLTQRRYRQVFPPLEGETFVVISSQGSHSPAARLSRGTAEQLYLALRFALVQEYSQGGRRLPLILDDILVNFDPHRARQAVHLLQEMGASHQLLLFTCHPHILELIKDTLGPAAPEPIYLEGGS
jgi:uncharacterized protein YhaN